MPRTSASISEYPTLVELAGDLTADDQDDGLFQFGIDLVLRGLDVLAKRR